MFGSFLCWNRRGSRRLIEQVHTTNRCATKKPLSVAAGVACNPAFQLSIWHHYAFLSGGSIRLCGQYVQLNVASVANRHAALLAFDHRFVLPVLLHSLS